MSVAWLDQFIFWISQQLPAGSQLAYTFNIKALLAIILVSLVSGSVGSLVVGARMAFFSDALAHCAFAGVAIGLLIGVFTGWIGGPAEASFHQYGLPFIM